MEPAGAVLVTVNLGGCEFMLMSLVLAEFEKDLLIGNDFLIHTNLVIDFADKRCVNSRKMWVRLFHSEKYLI